MDTPPGDALDQLLRQPSALAEGARRWRARIGRHRAPVAAGGVVAMALVVAAALWWPRVQGPPVEQSLPLTEGASVSSGAPAVSGRRSGATGGVPASSSTTVVAPVVNVTGAVQRSGVFTLPAGARVADAVAAAGGPTADADLRAVNLAAPAVDGTQVDIPRRGEAPRPTVGAPSGPGGTSGGGRRSGVGAGSGQTVDLNSATAEQLDALPGVGPATAAAIISYREQRGGFRSVEELGEVRGIGDARLQQLRPLVRVGGR